MNHIRAELDGAVGTITIDRPAAFNALDIETARDLRQASLQFARDDRVRAVVIAGGNGVFCSGADLRQVRAGNNGGIGYLLPAAHPREASCAGVLKQIVEYLHSTISEIKRSPKPFIAAVDGIAAAGGFGLAMACDLVLASERASFEWAYGRTGLSGAESSTFFLPRLIGLRRAMELVLLNPRLDARRALEYGLITAVYPAATFDDEARAIALRLAAGPTTAYGVAKGLLNEAAGVDRLDYHLDLELDGLTRVADEPNFAAGLEAFFAKRRPHFEAR
jgi:2-(1,2-epoxy-1,2-dihydrophenyl)acetyl-CoA isomerase